MDSQAAGRRSNHKGLNPHHVHAAMATSAGTRYFSPRVSREPSGSGGARIMCKRKNRTRLAISHPIPP